MSDYQYRLDNGCGDHGCYFVKPKGMGTNGGCGCLPTRSTMKWITESFKILAAKEQEIQKLEAAVRDMAETLGEYADYDESVAMYDSRGCNEARTTLEKHRALIEALKVTRA
jgi:hypothetical protein